MRYCCTDPPIHYNNNVASDTLLISLLKFSNVVLLHRLFDVDSPERPRRIIFRVLQSSVDSISTRVRVSFIAILDWFGQAARGVSRKLPDSFRSTGHRWNLALCPIFQFLGRRFFNQLRVDHRRMVWRHIRCDGVEQRSTIHNVRRRSRCVGGQQLRRFLRWWILVWSVVWSKPSSLVWCWFCYDINKI